MSANQLETLLRECDELKRRLAALGPLPEPVLRQVREDSEVLHTYHSNAIEGNTLTLGETKAVLLDGITVAGKRLQEHLEAVNHREAMRLMMRLAAVKKPLEESEILDIHRTILSGIQTEDAGRYRTLRVRVAGSMRVFPNPLKVPELMAEFIHEVNISSLHPIVVAADLHYGLVAIHPFADGNGRTARLLMNLYLIREGYAPAYFPVERRGQYYDALEAANNGDLLPFRTMVAEVVRDGLQRILEVARPS